MKIELYNKFTAELPDTSISLDNTEIGKNLKEKNVDYSFVLAADTNAVLTITHTENKLEPVDVADRISEYHNIYTANLKGFKSFSIIEKKNTNIPRAIMSYAINDDQGNDIPAIMAVLSADDEEYIISFSCSVKDGIKYMPKAMRIIDSINFIEGE